MKKRLNKKTSLKAMLIALSTLLVIPFLEGCSTSNNSSTESLSNSSISINNSTSNGDEGSLSSYIDYSNQDSGAGQSSGNNQSEQRERKALSLNSEDYIGDLEAFTYGLITNELEHMFSVFPAYVELSTSDYVYGLGYTDYSECYTNDDETIAYFMAGFITFVGELEISEEEFDTGLIINSLDYQDDETYFIWKYKTDPFYGHCVVYGNYLKYGVNEKDQYISQLKNIKEGRDESLGSLYSYDESRYVYDVDFGDYKPIGGVSLSIPIDFQSVQKEIEEILKKQDFNYAQLDYESIAYSAQEAVESYLLSLQEETILGCNVHDLIEASKQLDPRECFRITADGITVIDIEAVPPAQPTLLAKCLIGAGCAVLTAVGIVGSIIFVECPVLSSLAGAMTGAAMHLFMDVCISNKALSDVDWRKVGISAAAGAISGFVGPYLQTLSGAAYFITDTFVDGIVGGLDQAICALVDGKSWEDAGKAFGTGIAIGIALSGGLKIVGKLISAGVSAAAPHINKIVSKISPKVKKIASKFTEPLSNLSNSAKKLLGTMKKAADSSIFHSKTISKKLFYKNLAILQKTDADKMLTNSTKMLKKDGLLDVNGNPISKKQLNELAKNAKNGDKIGKFIVGDETVDIVKENGFAGLRYNNPKYLNIDSDMALSQGTTANEIRVNNLKKGRETLKKMIKDNPSCLDNYPELKEALKNSGKSLDNISDDQFKKILERSPYTLHENCDLKTITLVSKAVHDKTKGCGISHAGGCSLASYIRQHMGYIHFETFVSAAASGAVTVVPEIVTVI